MTRTLLDNLKQIYTASGFSALERADAQSIMVYEPGAILVEDQRIVDVGPRHDVVGRSGHVDDVVDLSGKVAIPGFVDPHTHLVFAGNRSGEFNARLHGESYVSIAAAGGGIKSTVRQTRAATRQQLESKAGVVLDRMLQHGVTSIEAKSGYGLNRETELKQLDVAAKLGAEHAIDVTLTFMGAHEVPPEFAGQPRAYLDFLHRDVMPAVADRGDVSYVDIFCEKNVFELDDTRYHMRHALDLGFKLRLHADELVHLGGAGVAAELGAVSADHLVYADPTDMKRMAEAGVIATLLPGTSFFLRGKYADVDSFLEAGCILALSTDFNPGSSHTCSQALMMALACMNLGMTFEQAFVGVTLNAAAAIERATEIGSLDEGKLADIAILDADSALDLVYFWGLNHVRHVMKRGAWVLWDNTIASVR